MEKIQELTEKLLREGVEKGNAEGQKLVEQAKAKAEEIVAQAQKQAQDIVAAARSEAQALEDHTQKELKLYAGQAVEAVKTEMTNVVTDRLVRDAVAQWSGSPTFMAEFIVELAKKWNINDGLVISTSDAAKLTAYFKAHAKTLLDKGVKIEQVNGNATSFSVAPADGSYKVNFGEEEFVAYFKEFLRPTLVEMLF